MIAGTLTYETKLDKKGFDEGMDDVNKKASKLESFMSGARKCNENSFCCWNRCSTE